MKSQIIHATFADGTFQPDENPRLPANARVRLIVKPLEEQSADQASTLTELEELWDMEEIESGPPFLTRDQLHDRDYASGLRLKFW